MGFAALAYSAAAAGVNAVNTDFLAAVDADFSQRSSHYILTEPYELIGAISVGASLTRGRFQVPHWNAIGEFTLSRANRSATVPSNPSWDNWTPYRPPIPTNEELQVQWSNNLGAATEQEQTLLLLGTVNPQPWTQNLPRGLLPIQARFTFTVTPTVNAWSGPQLLTASQALRGGVYAVIGATCQGTNAAFFRIVFPRYKLYNGRKLRPGGPVMNAVGDYPFLDSGLSNLYFGEWGRFHTFELPTAEVFGITAGSITYQLFLDMVYLGDNVAQLDQGLGGGSAGYTGG